MTTAVTIEDDVVELIKPFQRINTEFGEVKISMSQLINKILRDWHQDQLDKIGED